MLFFHKRKSAPYILIVSGLLALVGVGIIVALAMMANPAPEGPDGNLPENGEPTLTAREQEIKAEIEAAGSCQVDADCEAVYAPCPFGCWAAVNRSEAARITALMQSNQSTCQYMCVEAGPVECVASKCVVRIPAPPAP